MRRNLGFTTVAVPSPALGIDASTAVRMAGSESETVIGEHVPGNYFPILGVKPAIGRLIAPPRYHF